MTSKLLRTIMIVGVAAAAAVSISARKSKIAQKYDASLIPPTAQVPPQAPSTSALQ